MYGRLARDQRGDYPCAALGLALGVRAGEYLGTLTEWLRWIDATGEVLPTSAELAERERAARMEAEAEVAKLRAELDRLRAGR